MEIAIPVVMMFAPGNKTARMPYSVDGTAAVRSGELYLGASARRKYSATSTLALAGDFRALYVQASDRLRPPAAEKLCDQPVRTVDGSH